MRDTDWSLRRRTALEFSRVATVFLLLVGGGVAVAYRMVVQAELDEELVEQLEELRGRFRAGGADADEFERLVVPTGSEQFETPMAWRARTAAGEVWGPHGPARLVGFLGTSEDSLEVVRLPGGLRALRSELVPGVEVDLVLDGRDWIGRIRVFELVVAGIVVAGSLLSLLAGRVFGQRVGRLLERVAAEVERRDSRGADEAIHLPDAPREIRAVAEAVETTLHATRHEIERARLFTAGLAHDLRAPVQTLLTTTQVALLEPPSREGARALLEDHLAELRALARTVDNLVAWGSPRVDPGEDRALEFDLGRELEARLAAEEEAAGRAGVFLDVEREGDLSLRGDPVLLVLALRNLVGNAIAWSPSGGQVLVSLRGREDALEVHVDDEGPGVPAGEREAIFQPFVRGQAAPGRRAGYGLGLAIVARAVERHGGTVAVGQAPGGGARFTLRLPRG